MKELSLNILDIAKNSTRAGAKNIGIYLNEDENGILTLEICDDGCGMDEETLKSVSDPFYTSRKTRKVGLGIPFLILAARQSGGDVKITSKVGEGHGTKVVATFDTKSIDFTPIGNIVESLLTLFQGNDEINFVFEDNSPKRKVRLATEELKEVLGEVPISNPEVILWIREYLQEQYSS